MYLYETVEKTEWNWINRFFAILLSMCLVKWGCGRGTVESLLRRGYHFFCVLKIRIPNQLQVELLNKPFLLQETLFFLSHNCKVRRSKKWLIFWERISRIVKIIWSQWQELPSLLLRVMNCFMGLMEWNLVTHPSRHYQYFTTSLPLTLTVWKCIILKFVRKTWAKL